MTGKTRLKIEILVVFGVPCWNLKMQGNLILPLTPSYMIKGPKQSHVDLQVLSNPLSQKNILWALPWASEVYPLEDCPGKEICTGLESRIRVNWVEDWGFQLLRRWSIGGLPYQWGHVC